MHEVTRPALTEKDSLPGQRPNPAKNSPARRRTGLALLGMWDLPGSHRHRGMNPQGRAGGAS